MYLLIKKLIVKIIIISKDNTRFILEADTNHKNNTNLVKYRPNSIEIANGKINL